MINRALKYLGLAFVAILIALAMGAAFLSNLSFAAQYNPAATAVDQSDVVSKEAFPRNYYFVDVIPPKLNADDPRQQAISRIGKQWPQHSELTIRFIRGTEKERLAVIDAAAQWDDLVNLSFIYTDEMAADIRISFEGGMGSWSQIGTNAMAVDFNEATMNFGWDITRDAETILHEFGHALSLGHEHQNPFGEPIQWDEEIVLSRLAGAPNYWDEAEIRHNVLRKLSVDQWNGTAFDPESIMVYAFADNWTLNGRGTKQNPELSAKDKQYAGALYPIQSTLETAPVDSSASDKNFCQKIFGWFK